MLRFILVLLKYMRHMRLVHGPRASQSLYRVVGQSTALTFMNKFCVVVDTPSDAPRSDASDRFFRPISVPDNRTGLKDLSVNPDMNIVFSCLDLFGMTFSDFYAKRTHSDIRCRGLPTSD